MKQVASLFLVVLLSLMLVGVDAAHATRRTSTLKVAKGGAVVSLLTGPVEVLPGGRKEWRFLKLRDALRGGDEVRTGAKALLELSLPDSSSVRFAGSTHFKLIELSTGKADEQKGVRVHVALGRSWANVSKAVGVRKGGFELSCDTAVAGVRGTVYRMNVHEDKSALVRVYDGEVYVKGGGERITEAPKPMGAPRKISGPTKIEGPRKVGMQEWTVIIKSMQQIAIQSDGVAEAPRDFTEEEDKDPWVDWNRERDRSK
jgi:hypothetical protein